MPMLVVGISGPTCSGKTTIAGYLKRIFPRLVVLHEDDFYIPAAQLPHRAGFQNWDCAASIDQDRLKCVVGHARNERVLPAEFKSYQTEEEPSGAQEAVVQASQNNVQLFYGQQGQHRPVDMESSVRETNSLPDILLVEGFLLFGRSMTLLKDAFDLRILLGGKYEDLKRRRDGRTGYNTDEGFWKDPEGFFDLVVWPEYVEEHGFLFKNQDVNESVDEETAKREGIEFCPEENVEEMLKWTVRTMMDSLHKFRQRH